jgi:hypothetical protein
MSTKELRDRATKAIEGLSDRALLQLIELLEELRVASIDNDEERIERIIEENRNVLVRLAK